jgi:hemerythrin-like metal-binding protein
MSFVCWTEDLSVGHRGLDDQHKKLIDLINAYHDALERRAVRAELVRAFQDIADFAVRHFRDEESQMEKAGYPMLQRHKGIHQQLLDRVGQLQKQLTEAVTGVELQIQYFLKNWLTAHIKGIDTQYMPYLSSSARPAAARQTG